MKCDKTALAELRKHPGWAELQQYIEARKTEYANKIIRSIPTDSIGIATLQGRLAAMELIINKVGKNEN